MFVRRSRVSLNRYTLQPEGYIRQPAGRMLMLRNSAPIKGFGKILTAGLPLALRIGEHSGRKSANQSWIINCESGAKMKKFNMFRSQQRCIRGKQVRHQRLTAGILHMTARSTHLSIANDFLKSPPTKNGEVSLVQTLSAG